MAFDYPALRDNTVEPKIAEYGKPGTLYINDPEGGAPYESQFGDELAYPVTVLQTGFTKADNKGTLVEKGDVMFLVSTEGVTADPELAHRIEVNSITYQVVRVDPLFPGPTIMFWKVHARK